MVQLPMYSSTSHRMAGSILEAELPSPKLVGFLSISIREKLIRLALNDNLQKVNYRLTSIQTRGGLKKSISQVRTFNIITRAVPDHYLIR